MSFEIKLPLFQGPFDLLLFFIERDELDIYDIPISKITQDFLEYLHHLEKLNLEIASEFILVASTLMQIKAKLMLPRPQLDELGNEIDPREELVRHLLEYKRYKSVVGELASLEETRLSKEARGNLVAELKSIGEKSNVETELQDLDLYKLLRVFERVMQRQEKNNNRPVHTVVKYPYTIESQKEFIVNKLAEKKRLSFKDVVKFYKEKSAFVYNFLAILELLQLEIISIQIGEGFNNFWIEQAQPVTVN
ncbi:MAG: segregation/condensation protein A [Cytophagales bacterium]|nr:segregation/condensation protein A [Cytophagales bacterium]